MRKGESAGVGLQKPEEKCVEENEVINRVKGNAEIEREKEEADQHN